MKNLMKVAAVAAVLLVSASANAQYGPQKGDITTEVQFNPFSNNFSTFRLDGLSVRYFLNNNDAIRGTLKFNLNNNTRRGDLVEPDRANYASDPAFNAAKEQFDHQKDNYNKTTNTTIGLSLGYEHHFSRVGRLDMYAGAELGVEFFSASMTRETALGYDTDANGYSKWTTLKDEFKGVDYDPTATGATGKNSSFAFGGALFTGVDFYILENLYLGAELGLNISYAGAKDVEITKEAWDATNKKVVSTTANVNVKNNVLNMDLRVNPALRLGWKF